MRSICDIPRTDCAKRAEYFATDLSHTYVVGKRPHFAAIAAAIPRNRTPLALHTPGDNRLPALKNCSCTHSRHVLLYTAALLTLQYAVVVGYRKVAVGYPRVAVWVCKGSIE